MPKKQLHITFHGKIIEQLSLQMYQSPVAAVAEMISNAWDADSPGVDVSLPDRLDDSAAITIKDKGFGMTLKECEDKYLNIGWDKREADPTKKSPNGRTLLGRKGIGKFAGFGIAKVIRVETVSKETGERTVFEMDIEQLKKEGYMKKGGEIDVLEYNEPDIKRKENCGTVITLKSLTLERAPSLSKFIKSMSLRFTLHERAQDFKVLINNEPLVEDQDGNIEFSFPKSYSADEQPENMTIDERGWGSEQLTDGNVIKWKFNFYEETIGNEELVGISVFSGGKLCQTPFFFNLAGGLGSQYGQAYLSGQVQADYVDELEEDIIAIERQRINWEHPKTQALLDWGQKRVKELLILWKKRRGEERVKELERKIGPLSTRLERFPTHERKVIEGAIRKLASVENLKKEQFEELGNSLITAWDGGRLKELINAMESAESFDNDKFLSLLLESKALTAIHTAEAIRVKLDAIHGLYERINKKELENALRDYIANDPWLISPKWQTFAKESRVKTILDKAANSEKMNEPNSDWAGRVDLALSSGSHLLVIEFMRPGLKLDKDHLDRFEWYIRKIGTEINSNSGLGLTRVSGYVVADGLTDSAEIVSKINDMKKDEKFVMDWKSLLVDALSQWKEFLKITASHNPHDERVKQLLALLDES